MSDDKPYLKDIFKIGVLNAELILPNKEQLINKLHEESKIEGRRLSNLTGYQSNNLDLNDPIYKPFLNGVIEKGSQLAKDMDIIDNVIVDNFWLNINNYKDSNSLHCHPGAVFSGVYYVHTPENSGDIVFLNSNHDYVDFYWKNSFIKDFNNYNSSEFNVVPYTNQIIIFPGWLKHYVRPNLNHESRLSISFNLGVKNGKTKTKI